MKNTLARKLTSFLNSRLFLYIVLGFFVFEALWFVFSAMYPMAFDEEYHLGLIKLYADHSTPFLSSQPAGADAYGAVARDPSYLFHYLMSFPYRFLRLFTSNETAIIICLRLINVAMFTWGLWLYRKVMLRAKASRALISVALAVFVLIPIVPQLAAHINYDNAFMVLVPAMCLLSFRLVESFRERRIDTRALIGFVIICMTMALVKYAALPICAAAAAFLLVYLILSFRGKYGKLWRIARSDYMRLARNVRLGLVGLLLIMSGLFAQRYIVNLAKYHTPVPDCGVVLTVKQCSAYGPWIRDYRYSNEKPDNFKPSLAKFVGSWFGGMWHRLFFAINGKHAHYTNYKELLVPSIAAIVLSVAGLAAVIAHRRKLFRNDAVLAFILTVSLGYAAVLWLDGYAAYNHTGRIVAINGRYLLPILLLLAVVIGRAFSIALRKKADVKPYLAVFVILLFLHGGGLMTFILRSDNSWYWPNQIVRNVNNAVRSVLAPVIIEGPK
ncbi:MAG TPA: hypothetical protein VF809_00115 [Candidatus Saccharimonadales bacterium]